MVQPKMDILHRFLFGHSIHLQIVNGANTIAATCKNLLPSNTMKNTFLSPLEDRGVLGRCLLGCDSLFAAFISSNEDVHDQVHCHTKTEQSRDGTEAD